MKRLFILGFSAALIAGGVSSCKKTSKGKMANEWTVSSVTSESTDTFSNGNKTVSTTAMADGKITDTDISTNSSGTITTISTGTVKEYSYTIEKDGTWKSTTDMTYSSSFIGGSSTGTTVNNTSGTWSFLSKNKSGDFKKNERVVFNTLKEDVSFSGSYTAAGVTTPSAYSNSDTFAEGENTEIFLVVESKKKELKLSQTYDETSSNTNSGGTTLNSYKGTSTMTLVQK